MGRCARSGGHSFGDSTCSRLWIVLYSATVSTSLFFSSPSHVQSSTQNPQNGKQKHTHVTEADYQVLFMHISVAISYHSCSYYGKRLQNGTQRQRQNTGDAKHTHHQPSGNGRDRARCCEAAGVLTIYKKEKGKKRKEQRISYVKTLCTNTPLSCKPSSSHLCHRRSYSQTTSSTGSIHLQAFLYNTC